MKLRFLLIALPLLVGISAFGQEHVERALAAVLLPVVQASPDIPDLLVAQAGHDPDVHHDTVLGQPRGVTVGFFQTVVALVLSGRRVMSELRQHSILVRCVPQIGKWSGRKVAKLDYQELRPIGYPDFLLKKFPERKLGLKPSFADTNATKSLENACRAVDLMLFDHIIIADSQYYSFQEEKMSKYNTTVLNALASA